MNIPYLQKEDMGDDEDSDGSYSHSQLPPKRGGTQGSLSSHRSGSMGRTSRGGGGGGGGGGGRRKRVSDEYLVKRHRGGEEGVTTAIRIQMIGEKEGGNQMNTSVR